MTISKNILYTLNNDLKIPGNGFGLYKVAHGEVRGIIHEALRVGYRHFDTAKYYQNEQEVADEISSYIHLNNIERVDIFYTTKIWDDDHGYESAKIAIQQSLEKAKALGCIDLFLIHSPQSNKEKRLGTYQALQEAVSAGMVKSIGVSNYGIPHLEELLNWEGLKIKPVVNQVELHPWMPRIELREYCKSKGILMEAYAPITRGKKFTDPGLISIAKKHGCSPADVLIRWSFDQGFIVLVKTSTVSRIEGNFNVVERVTLDEDDIKLLHKPDSHEKCTYWDPTLYEG
uniref:Aldo-keto reductase n=1 Tax=Cyberlindnera americana TaxID=36016 RepID=A0A5P8N8S8_9ASCO|nr:aldo-keto reductase [Cyberlindnera americana]